MRVEWFIRRISGSAAAVVLGALLTASAAAQQNPPLDAPRLNAPNAAAPQATPPARQADQSQPAAQNPQASQGGNQAQQSAPQGQNQAEGRAELGIAIAPSIGQGVLVEQVRPGGPAQQAGIEPGDYIIAIGDQETNTPQRLIDLVRQATPGEKIAVSLWRGGDQQTVMVTPVERQQTGYRGAGQDFGFAEAPQQQQNSAWLGVLLADESQTGQGGTDQTANGQNNPNDNQNQGNDQNNQNAPAAPQRGVVITQVFPASPAAQAGLRFDDAILAIGGKEVTSAQDVANLVAQSKPGDPIKLTILRNNKEREITATLADSGDFLGGGGSEFMQDMPQGRYGYIPEHMIQLEQYRRLAEQNQRLEGLIRDLSKEVQTLRQEMQQLRGARAQAGQPQQ